MNSPKVYLAVDNCFGFKRWTEPCEWARVISELGVKYIEASADTELDPAYMGRDYLQRWLASVKKAEKEFNIKVANLYSGHGSYTTLGLAHTDSGVRQHMKEHWFKPMIEVAAELDAGFGFFAHGFSHAVLQDKIHYQNYVSILTDNLVELCAYAHKVGCKTIGVEQMYTPHQIPWRISQTRQMMRDIKEAGYDFYFTEDVGHHHTKFIRPEQKNIEMAIEAGSSRGIWMGTDEAYLLFERAVKEPPHKKELLKKILCDIEEHEYLFSSEEDGNCFRWLEELGCFAPIVHLQQTDGVSSAHKLFTEENNAEGIIGPENVLDAIQKSYAKCCDIKMPTRCTDIYLTIEAFFSTAILPQDGLVDYKSTIDYFRTVIPEDGMEISKMRMI